MTDEPMDNQRLIQEALRVYHRYATEVVEPLGLCPWAKRARLDGRVTRRVIVKSDPDPADILPHLDAVADDASVDIGLLLLPRLSLDLSHFRRFVNAVRQADSARHPPGGGHLYMAEFHPQAALDTGSSARLVSFIRRTPDPTIQLVRRAVLDEVRAREPSGTQYMDPQALIAGDLPEPPPAPLHERIADTNFAAIEEFGFARLSAIMDDIRADRDRAYAALAGPQS